jgi:hypothetical protein
VIDQENVLGFPLNRACNALAVLLPKHKRA